MTANRVAGQQRGCSMLGWTWLHGRKGSVPLHSIAPHAEGLPSQPSSLSLAQARTGLPALAGAGRSAGDARVLRRRAAALSISLASWVVSRGHAGVTQPLLCRERRWVGRRQWCIVSGAARAAGGRQPDRAMPLVRTYAGIHALPTGPRASPTAAASRACVSRDVPAASGRLGGATARAAAIALHLAGREGWKGEGKGEGVHAPVAPCTHVRPSAPKHSRCIPAGGWILDAGAALLGCMCALVPLPPLQPTSATSPSSSSSSEAPSCSSSDIS